MLQQTHSALSTVEEEMPSLTNLNCKIISQPQEQLVFSHHRGATTVAGLNCYLGNTKKDCSITMLCPVNT